MDTDGAMYAYASDSKARELQPTPIPTLRLTPNVEPTLESRYALALSGAGWVTDRSFTQYNATDEYECKVSLRVGEFGRDG